MSLAGILHKLTNATTWNSTSERDAVHAEIDEVVGEQAPAQTEVPSPAPAAAPEPEAAVDPAAPAETATTPAEVPPPPAPPAEGAL